MFGNFKRSIRDNGVPLEKGEGQKKVFEEILDKTFQTSWNFKPTDPRNSTNTRNEKKLVFYTWGKYPS